MPITLNASTASGLVVTPDNSGNILLQYNGVAAPAFCAYQSASQAIPNNTFTKITYDTKVFDTANCFNTSTNRFTPNVAGYYIFTATMNYSSAPGGNSPLAFYKNGVWSANGGSGSTTGGSYINGSTIFYMNGSTDYVEIWQYQNSGGTLSTDAQTRYTFTGCLLRGA